MSNRKHCLQSSRRSRLEVLEDRTLLAGDVMAAVVDGSLLIHGDELDNNIMIQPGREAGEYVITGRPDSSGEATMVNGARSFKATGVTADVAVRMGRGNDTVAVVPRAPEVAVAPRALAVEAVQDVADVAPIRLPGNVGIGMGPGADKVVVRNADVRGNLSISGGRGRDAVGLHAVHVGENLTIKGQRGKDAIAVGDSRVGGNMYIAGGRGADTIRADHVGVEGNARIRAGRGDDSVAVVGSKVGHNLAISARAGNNDIAVHGTDVHGRVSIRTGRGDDTIRAGGLKNVAPGDAVVENGNATWGGATIFDAGGENDIALRHLSLSRGGLELRTARRGGDNVRLTDVEVRGDTRISTGGGEDRLAIVDSVFGSSFVLQMGYGDDTAGVKGSTFHGPTVMLGGPGQDTLKESDNTFLGLFFENFEL